MNNFTTALHDEKTFYKAFLRDIDLAREEIIIESPFITSSRMKTLWPYLRSAHARGVKLYIITRDPNDHSDGYEMQSEREIEAFVAVTSTCRVPVEVLHVRSGDADSLPISALGKTSVKYVGATPMISVEPDANGNLEMLFTGTGAVEILYNSKKMGSRGMNGRPQGKKKIYIVN